ncbi:MAG: hypothetical protein GX811_08440 [Lentisphaerae bacterium]|nr:hypothetical protein [Lentisphaerota bacterium]
MTTFKHYNRVFAEVNLVSSHFGDVNFEDDWILIERFNLPASLNRRTSKLLIILPYNYPEAPPHEMYLEKGLKKHGRTPEHYFENKYGDSDVRNRGYAWYSIHFRTWRSSANSMIQGDNLITACNALYDALKFDEGNR